MSTLKIEFANREAMREFAVWLTESGEQQYWDWMEVQEERDPSENITVLEFDYHGPENKQLPKTDPNRYGEFLCDDTIRTVCGRLSR